MSLVVVEFRLVLVDEVLAAFGRRLMMFIWWRCGNGWMTQSPAELHECTTYTKATLKHFSKQKLRNICTKTIRLQRSQIKCRVGVLLLLVW